MARRLILDSGAVSAIAQGDRVALAWATVACLNNTLISIPVPVLAETMTGRPTDALIYRAFDLEEDVLPTTAEIAREAGTLRFRASSTQTVDAIDTNSAFSIAKQPVLAANDRFVYLQTSATTYSKLERGSFDPPTTKVDVGNKISVKQTADSVKMQVTNHSAPAVKRAKPSAS